MTQYKLLALACWKSLLEQRSAQGQREPLQTVKCITCHSYTV